MAKKPDPIVMVRLPAEAKKALGKAAQDESVPPSTLMRILTIDWLRRHGYLPKKSRQERR